MGREEGPADPALGLLMFLPDELKSDRERDEE
jgi:hypothetical protein